MPYLKGQLLIDFGVQAPAPEKPRRATTHGKSAHQRFVEFHALNPQVYVELVRLARQARAQGHSVMGIAMLWEVARWHFFLKKNDPNSDFKFNDHYKPHYARLIMEREPDLSEVFNTRELAS